MTPATRRRIAEAARPLTGPCGFCGSPDSRHRVWDAMRGMHAAGDPIAWVAEEYGTTRAVALAVARGPRWWK